MKSIQHTWLWICLIALSACSGLSAPSFVGMEEVKIRSAGVKTMKFVGKAVYNNPNPIGGTLVHTNIKIFVDDVEVTEIDQENKTAIPANSDFQIPVEFSFNPKVLVNNEKLKVGKLLRRILKDGIDVKYDGTVTISIKGIEFDVPIHYKEKVSYGVKYN